MMTVFKQIQTILLFHSCVCEFSADVILKLNSATQIRREFVGKGPISYFSMLQCCSEMFYISVSHHEGV